MLREAPSSDPDFERNVRVDPADECGRPLGDPRLYVCQAPGALICASPCGSILGPFWVHFGSILGPCWVHVGSMLGPFWVHFGSILGPFWVHFGSILGPFWVHFGSILGPFWGPFGVHVGSESITRQECSLDKNSSLKKVRAKRAKVSERSKLRCRFSRRIW